MVVVVGKLALSASLFASIVTAATSGDFNILAFNVAGLPDFINDNGVPGDKGTNHETIGTLISQRDFDVVHVQEDFAYHSELYSTDTHPHRTSTSGNVPFGSGLNTMSNFPFTDLDRVGWDDCSNTDSQDCLTPKGFTFMRVAIDPDSGASIDFYNVHADAGGTPADLEARASNLRQVAAYIDTHSAGNAVLVYGDVNSRYSRAGDIPGIFQSQNGMVDPWVELVHGGTPPAAAPPCPNPAPDTACEIVDKVFYRGSRSLTLQATAFAYESGYFRQADGSILSDHNPVGVNFTWAVGEAFRRSSLWGGPHGDWFNDVDAMPEAAKPSRLRFAGDERVDSVGVTLADGAEMRHGGDGGDEVTLDLEATEYWTQATLCQDKHETVFHSRTRIFFIEAVTSAGRTLAAGTRQGECVTWAAEEGWQISGFMGRSGDEVSRLGFIYTRQ